MRCCLIRPRGLTTAPSQLRNVINCYRFMTTSTNIFLPPQITTLVTTVFLVIKVIKSSVSGNFFLFIVCDADNFTKLPLFPPLVKVSR